MVLGWTGEIVSLFISHDNDYHQTVTIVMAVLSIYVVDFAINLVQACARSLIVDVLPISKQQQGTAWGARMGGTGHLLGYLIGTLDLVNIFPTWMGGDTQFKKMCVVAAGCLWFAVGLTSWAVTERVLLKPAGDKNSSVVSELSALWYQCFHLPERISQICWVQFWSWIGWFPILFYGSTWVGETYYRYDHPEAAEQESVADALGDVGRLGSTTFVIFSSINFASAFLIPLLVQPTNSKASYYRSPTTNSSDSKLSSLLSVLDTALDGLWPALQRLQGLRPSLITTWIVSNLFFACLCFYAPFVRSWAAATVVVALAGIPWAITVWAPFAEMGVEINKLAVDNAGQVSPIARIRANGAPVMTTRVGGYAPVRSTMDHDEDDSAIEMEEGYADHSAHSKPGQGQYARRRSHSRSNTNVSQTGSPSHHRSRSFSSGILRINHPDDLEDSSTGELAGLYLGVLNIYTTLPQFLGTGLNWLIFLIFEPARSDSDQGDLNLQKEGPNAIAITMVVGAICSVVAAEAGRRLRKSS